MSRGTQDPATVTITFLYGTLTRSGRAFQRVRVVTVLDDAVLQPRPFRGKNGLGSSRFARHYYGNLG